MASPMRYDGKVALVTGAGNGKYLMYISLTYATYLKWCNCILIMPHTSSVPASKLKRKRKHTDTPTSNFNNDYYIAIKLIIMIHWSLMAHWNKPKPIIASFACDNQTNGNLFISSLSLMWWHRQLLTDIMIIFLQICFPPK